MTNITVSLALAQPPEQIKTTKNPPPDTPDGYRLLHTLWTLELGDAVQVPAPLIAA